MFVENNLTLQYKDSQSGGRQNKEQLHTRTLQLLLVLFINHTRLHRIHFASCQQALHIMTRKVFNANTHKHTHTHKHNYHFS